MSKINTNKISSKIRVRIMRPWRGYAVGTIINPPGAMRQILMQTKDALGKNVAEIVEDEIVEVEEKDIEVKSPVKFQKKRGRPGKK